METHVNADELSHTPITFCSSCHVQLPQELVLFTEHLKQSPFTHDHCETHYVINSWSDSWDSSLSAYYLKQEELSVHQGCLLYISLGCTSIYIWRHQCSANYAVCLYIHRTKIKVGVVGGGGVPCRVMISPHCLKAVLTTSTWGSPWYYENEITHLEVCLVSKNWWKHWTHLFSHDAGVKKASQDCHQSTVEIANEAIWVCLHTNLLNPTSWENVHVIVIHDAHTMWIDLFQLTLLLPALSLSCWRHHLPNLPYQNSSHRQWLLLR